MPVPSTQIIQALSVFAVAFTTPTYHKALTLLFGTILAPGRRTVASALRMVGLAEDPHFTNYHRVLNRNPWSLLLLSRLLLGLLIQTFVTPESPLRLAIDDTLERREGKQIRFKGRFHDAVRSTAAKVVTSLGLRWICLALVVTVPWSQRPWALPFMVILTLAPRTSEKVHKAHHTLVDWAVGMIRTVRRWYPDKEILLVGDGGYAAVVLIQACQKLNKPVGFISRLRLDAALYAFPETPDPHQRGPKPKKGQRLPNLAQRLEDPRLIWEKVTLPWYGGGEKAVEYASETCLWYHRGEEPVPIRWVLVRSQDNSFKTCAFFCSDPELTPLAILKEYVLRWNIEVTFEEIRAYLGFETQRQWSDLAIQRETPCLFGTFSLTVVLAKVLYPEKLPVRQAEWYEKEEASFSDVLAVVRRHLWERINYSDSGPSSDMVLIPRSELASLLEVASYSV